MRREDFLGFRSLESKVADKAWKYIELEDFEEAVDKTWNLFFIEAKKFLNAPADHENGFSVRLVDNLSKELELDEDKINSLHKLRKLRNKIVKRGHEPNHENWSLIRTVIEVLNLVLTTKKPNFVDGAKLCPDCGAVWDDDYDECDWCGWSGKPSPPETISHEGRTNCEECGEKWDEDFEICDWCGWPHPDED
jgi:RNA polymerase subunit RPABC4/transcription elongation factor Spt4